ncbi:hypothetical protein HN51_011264 [Arachis hypogaea]
MARNNVAHAITMCLYDKMQEKHSVSGCLKSEPTGYMGFFGVLSDYGVRDVKSLENSFTVR